MKRIVSFFCIITMLIGMSGCAKHESELFTSNKDDFIAVVEFARQYYAEHKSEDSDYIAPDFYGEALRGLIVLDCYDGVLRDHIDDTVIEDISDDIRKSVEIIGRNFDYLWVTDIYVIFWENETKYYGLLWSESKHKAISSLKEWYPEMENRRLESNWHEIGALNAI